MLRGLWKLTWLEIKIFLREPLGAFGSILFPVLVFVVVGRLGRPVTPGSLSAAGFLRVGLPVFVSVLIAHQRGIVAGHDHLDLPGRRHSQTAPRHAATPADDSHRSRAGQTGAHGGHHGA